MVSAEEDADLMESTEVQVGALAPARESSINFSLKVVHSMYMCTSRNLMRIM